MKNKHLLKIALLGAFMSTLLLSAAMPASAARMTIPRKLCDLGVFPWNPSGTVLYGDALTAWINYVSATVCDTHLTIPTSTPFTAQAYTPHGSDFKSITDSSDIPLKTGADAKHGPIANHSHDYFNDSKEDSYYYESFVKKFAIDFAPDEQANINKVTCETPYPKGYDKTKLDPVKDCDGDVDDLWGGTHVEKTSSGVVWTFGTKDPLYLPKIFGYNSTLDPLIGGGFDSSNENNRSFGANVNLTTFDVGSSTNAWAATTSSRILVRDFGIAKTSDMTKLTKFCGTAGDYANGWCSFASPAGYQEEAVGTKKFFWFPIGSTSSVWKKKPATVETACSAITLDPSTVNAPGKTDYTAKVSFADGKTYNAEVTWSQTGSGTFTGGSVQKHSSGTNYLNTYNTTATTGTVTAKVTAIDGAKNSTKCQDGVTVESPPAACESISVLPSTVNAPGSTAYTATVKFDDGKTYNTEVTWSETGGGTFASPAVQKHSSTTNYTNTYNTLNTVGTVTAKVTDVDGAANSAICEGGATVLSPPKPYCSAITLTPTSLKAPGTNPFTAKVTYSDGKSYNTEVTWSQTNGSLVPPLVQTHLSSSDFKNTYTTAAKSGSVTAQVTDVLDPKVSNSELCQNGTTVKTPDLACNDSKFILTSSNGNPLAAGETSTLKASGQRTDGTAIPTMNWTTTGGTLMPQGICAGFWTPGSTLTNYPSACTVGFGGGPAGTVINVSAIPPESGAICKRQIKVEEKGNKPYCVSVDLNPNKLNTSGNTNLSAKVKFSDGKSYDTTVQWSGNNGTFTNSTTKTDTSANLFLNTFKKNSNTDPADASVRVIDVPDPDAENSDECYAGTKISTEENKCKNLTLIEKSNGEVCANVEGEFKGQFEWTIDGDSPFLSYKNCQPVPPNTSVKVFATSTCKDQLTTHERPPGLHKGVRLDGSGAAYSTVLSVNGKQTDLEYQIVFETDPVSKTSAYIKDDISSGKIDGHTYPTPKPAGYIDYVNGSMKVNRQKCSDKVTENCYTGDIGAGGIYLVKVSGPVVITYKGKITNSIMKDPAICKGGEVCQEKYLNTAKVPSYEVYDSTGKTIMSGSAQSEDVWVQIFCQYILTRAAGDIYLESDLNAGVDIRQCSKYTSSTGILVVPTTPGKPGLVKTGPSEIFSIPHEICTAGQAGTLSPELKKYYGETVVKNLSSQICEVRLQPGTSWQQKTITNSIDENKTRLSRWEADYDGIDVNMSSITADPAYSEKSVYHVKNGNLTISNPYILADGDGAKTFIVENGDLYVKGNVSYGSCPAEKAPCTVTTIGSLAFIVLNGSVYVDKDVTEMSGVYFVQEGQGEGARPESGIVAPLNNESSYNQLVIYGSIYGDIEKLFENRLYAGDPSLEEAGIVVRFDERIILNTPPGLRDVLSLTETEVAR